MIKFKAKYDNNIVKNATIFSFMQIIIPLSIISVVILLIGIVNLILLKTLIGILWIVFSLAYIPITYLIIYLTQTNKYKSRLQNFDKDLQIIDGYEFFDNSVSIIILVEKDNFSEIFSKESVSYSEFKSVIEKNDKYIFTRQKSIVVIIPKNSIVIGTIEEFNKLLTNKYGNKFKKMQN